MGRISVTRTHYPIFGYPSTRRYRQGVSRNDHAPKALGEAVRQLRVQGGVTQQDLAARLDVPQSWVSNIEGARRRLGVLEALELCEVLERPFAQLLTEYEKRRDASE